MKVIRTIRCRLTPDDPDVPILQDVFRRYSRALTEIAQWGRDHQESNSVRLHHALYYEMRRKFGLPANLVVTALRRAAGVLKAARLKGRFEFRPTFVALDERTFSLMVDKEMISFSTHDGRRKAKLVLGEYQRQGLRGGHVQSATLVWAKNGWYANIVVESEVAQVANGGVLGVDVGIRRIAATSAGTIFDGKPIRDYRELRARVRASLQSKGTRGAKKVLRSLSGREARHCRHVNHRIAKAIVDEAKAAGCSRIALEELNGIRDQLRVRSPHKNRMISFWAYAELQALIRHKAAMSGIEAVYVPAHYSSLTCASCGTLGARKEQTFSCASCGLVTDADVNAARVIAARGAAVNRPELDGQACRKAS